MQLELHKHGELRQKYDRLRGEALALTDKAMTANRDLSADETAKLTALVEEAKSVEAELKALAPQNDLLNKLMTLGGGGTKADGQRELHPWTKAMMESPEFGLKALTGGGQGSTIVGSLGDPAARLGAPGGELLAQIAVEPWGMRGDGSVAQFLRQSSRNMQAAIVPVSTAKPASDVGLDMLTAATWTFAHTIPGVPTQWLTDAQNLNTLLTEELRYGLVLAVEKAIVSGPGALPAAPLGILNDPAVPVIPAPTGSATPADAILSGLTAVSAAGYSTGVVALHPAAWQAIQGSKDTVERPLYPGSPFAGPTRLLWGSQVVTSVALPHAQAIVGDLGFAIRYVERDLPTVVVGTQGAEFASNERTFLGETRAAFVTIRPQALAVVNLGASIPLAEEAKSKK